jgi:dihydrofolate reductase
MRPLPDRLSVVLTKNADFKAEVTSSCQKTPAPIVMNEMSDALHMLSQNEKVGEIFVIGGQALYEQSLTDF